MPLGEALEVWTDGFFTDEIYEEADRIIDGRPPISDFFSQAAATLLWAIRRQSCPAPVLWSGIPDSAFMPLRVGEQMTFALKSFSERKIAARQFALGALILEMPESRGLPAALFSAHPLESEWLLSGSFEITRIGPDPDDYVEVLIWIRQVTTTTAV